MAEGSTFQELLRRVRTGDEAAAAEVLRLYEPLIRVEARLRLTDPRMRRLYDSLDICQSVLASFFVRTASGQYDLERPDQLVRLLMTMVRNKIASRARGQRRRDADQRRDETANVEGLASTADPSQRLEGQEL